jgi:hypothetical protein
MPRPIVVNVDLPTDNNDVLNGSLLDPIPSRGVLMIFLASSQRDGVLSVVGPGIAGAYKVPPVLRANGIPDVSGDIPYIIPVPAAGKLKVDYDEVTAGDAFATFMFFPG